MLDYSAESPCFPDSCPCGEHNTLLGGYKICRLVGTCCTDLTDNEEAGTDTTESSPVSHRVDFLYLSSRDDKPHSDSPPKVQSLVLQHNFPSKKSGVCLPPKDLIFRERALKSGRGRWKEQLRIDTLVERGTHRQRGHVANSGGDWLAPSSGARLPTHCSGLSCGIVASFVAKITWGVACSCFTGVSSHAPQLVRAARLRWGPYVRSTHGSRHGHTIRVIPAPRYGFYTSGFGTLYI